MAHISNFEYYEKILKNGYLLCAYQKDAWVGAILVVRENNWLKRGANIGWRDGADHLFRDHICGALAFELMNRAKTEGFKYLNMGNSLPFVDDGVFQFKKRWGFRPVLPGFGLENGKDSRKESFLAVYFNLASKSGQAILHQNPVMVKNGNKLSAVAWDTEPKHNVRRLFNDGIPWIDLMKT